MVKVQQSKTAIQERGYVTIHVTKTGPRPEKSKETLSTLGPPSPLAMDDCAFVAEAQACAQAYLALHPYRMMRANAASQKNSLIFPFRVNTASLKNSFIFPSKFASAADSAHDRCYSDKPED